MPVLLGTVFPAGRKQQILRIQWAILLVTAFQLWSLSLVEGEIKQGAFPVSQREGASTPWELSHGGIIYFEGHMDGRDAALCVFPTAAQAGGKAVAGARWGSMLGVGLHF